MGCNAETYLHIVADSWDKLDAAIELIEPLLTYIDEEKNILKRNQMLQLAKTNGSLQLNQFENDKAGELMLIEEVSGPLGSDQRGVFHLPNHLRNKINQQYMRDVADVKGIAPVNIEEQFNQFMTELDPTYKKSELNLTYPSVNKEQCSRTVKSNQFWLNNNLIQGSPYGGYSPLS